MLKSTALIFAVATGVCLGQADWAAVTSTIKD